MLLWTSTGVLTELACRTAMDNLVSLRKAMFAGQFSSRALKRGRAYSMEGYVFNVNVEASDTAGSRGGSVVVSATCFASYRKKRKHAVLVNMRCPPSFRLLQCSCECEAGEGERCSHVCGVLFYLAAHAAFLREEVEAESATSPTSGRRQWGVPKRHIAPDAPICRVNFRQVKEGEVFNPVAASSSILDPRPIQLRTVKQEDVERLVSNYQASGQTTTRCLMLRYVTPDRVVECLEGRFYDSNLHGTLYEEIRPKPVQFPKYLASLFSDLRLKALPPSEDDLLVWVEELCGALGSVNYEEVEEQTRQQAGSDDWFKERVVRLTASNFGRIVSRQRNFHSLVEEIIYKKPPAALPSLVFGRAIEGIAVDRYAALHPEWRVSECGLVIHPELPFVAASPDRILFCPSTGERGVLEVKCPSSLQVGPTVAAREKASFCLQKVDGRISLKTSHKYYWQVQGQMACCGLQWCDFVVFAADELFVERVMFDCAAWERCVSLLKNFYRKFYGQELVYPSCMSD